MIDANAEPFAVASGEVTLQVEVCGPESAPCLVLLHGYPDNRRLWDPVIAALGSEFRVIRYDVRGAGGSTAPRSTAGYHARHLTDDLIAVTQAACPGRSFHLVGVDWGALQGWEALLSGRLAGRIASFTCTTPALEHAGHWLRQQLQPLSLAGLGRFGQRMAQSSYMLLFQLPWLPEAVWARLLAARWPALLLKLEGIRVSPDPQLRQDAQRGIGLYRANLRESLLRRPRSTSVPVQVIKLLQDPFVNPELFQGFHRWAPDLMVQQINAGHWGGVSSHAPEFAGHLARFVRGVAARQQLAPQSAAPAAPSAGKRSAGSGEPSRPRPPRTA
jgi:pimeloyl-ACP methyl ester carboxylesterase